MFFSENNNKAKDINSFTMQDTVKERINKLTGTPTITLRDADGNIIDQYTNHNLIVEIGRAQIIKFLKGDVSAGITKCSVGTNGVDSNNAFSPISPKDSDTALYAEVTSARKNIDTVTYNEASSATQITFTTLFTSANVNAIVSEAGLFFTDGKLFARYTFPSMYLKNDKGYSLEISWVVQF